LTKSEHPDFEVFRRALSRLSPIPPAEWASFRRILSRKRLRKGGTLITLGGDPTEVAFVLKGLLKASYTTHDGNEFIRNFSPERTFVAAYSSLLTGQPSNVTVRAIEDAELITFPFPKYERHLERHACWQEIGRKLAELHYLMREKRQYELLALDAQERYRSFRKEFAPLLGRLSQQDIATYIGVTPISFSRLKRSLLGKKR
jgi:CRP-like cAMP-binding protein